MSTPEHRKTRNPPSMRVDLPGERWAPVLDYEGLYLVSNRGRVARIVTRWGAPCWKLITPVLRRSGHLQVSLSRNRVGVTRQIHHLVAHAFIGARPAWLVVNHINGVPSDNTVENLEYVTQKENVLHSIYVLGRGPTKREACRRGHALTDDNVQVGSDQRRRCRICIRYRKRRNRRAKVAA